jgi:hypothetical protein
MSEARFRFATDILRRLGEELNPGAAEGILELVKNSYDADATECIVELSNTESSDGTLRIGDNGDGMTPSEISAGWLTLGTSLKSPSHTTRLGRKPSGSKGLGRLATMRLGERVELATRPAGSSTHEHYLRIDWRRFDRAALVDEVELSIRTQRRPSGSESGTDVTIGPLRRHLTRGEVKRLARAMLLLADPFRETKHAFRPVLRAPEFEDLERLVAESYFGEADYHLKARVDARGRAKAEVIDFRGNRLFVATHEAISRGDAARRYRCPRVQFEFWGLQPQRRELRIAFSITRRSKTMAVGVRRRSPLPEWYSRGPLWRPRARLA